MNENHILNRDFELKTTAKTQILRQSPLFYFMRHNDASRLALLPKHTNNWRKALQNDAASWRFSLDSKSILDPSDSRAYFLIRLKNPAITVHDNPSFALVEKHIRIDETYFAKTENQKIFSQWHYTEVYKDVTSGKTCIFHCYYNCNVLLAAYQTDPHGNRNEVIDTQILSKLLENAQHAHAVMLLLNKALDLELDNSKLEFQNKQDSMSAAKYLMEVSEEDLEHDLDACNKISDKLNNLSNQRFDRIFNIFAKNIRYRFLDLNAPEVIVSAPTLENSITNDQNTKMHPAKTNQVKANKVKINPKKVKKSKYLEQKHLLQLMKQVNDLATAYVTPIAANLCDNADQKAAIEFEIEVAMCSIEQQNEAEVKVVTNLQRLHNKLKGLPGITQLAFEFAAAADEESLEQFFYAVKNTLPNAFFEELLLHILETLNECDSEDKDSLEILFVRLLNYFYEESDKYRLFISQLPRKLITPGIDQNSADLQCAFVYQFALNGHKFIFEAIIKHSGTANYIGLIYKNITVSLLGAVANIDNTSLMTESLLKLGAKVEHSNMQNEKATTMHNMHPEAQQYVGSLDEQHAEQKLRQKYETTITNAANWGGVDSALYAHCNNPKPYPSVLKLLIPQSNDFNLILAMTAMLANAHAYGAMQPSNSTEIYNLSHLPTEQQYKILQHLESNTNDATHFSYFLNPQGAQYLSFELMIKAIQSRIATDVSRMDNLINELDSFMQLQHKAQNHTLAIVGLNAKILLLNYKSSMQPDIKTHQAMLEAMAALRKLHRVDTNPSGLFFQRKMELEQINTAGMTSVLSKSVFKEELLRNIGSKNKNRNSKIS